MARNWLKKERRAVVVSEIASGSEQPDALGWRGTETTLIECKASRADFLADRKKFFRRNLWQGIGDFRYYLAPVGVVRETDALPEGFGLLEVNPVTGKIQKRIQARRQPEKATRREVAILLSLIRRIGQTQPQGCSISCYTYETKNRTVLEIEKEGEIQFSNS